LKILIAGSGKVGETLVRQLSDEGYDLTVIDSNAQKLEKIVEQYDVMAVEGNCASMATLKQAGAEQADLMIVATGSDEVNLLCSMTVHGLNPKIHTIARIRNPEYAEQAYFMRDIFGLSLAINPERQAAIEIERLLKYPGFLKRDSFSKGRVEIAELKLEANSKLCNVPLNGIYNIVKCRMLVCAVLRNGTAIMPDGRFVLQAEDKLFIIATRKDLSLLLKNIGIVTHRVRRVILAGGGSIAYYLADALEDDRMKVTVIEQNRERCLKLAELLPNVNIIHGNASNRDLLESEGLADCDALVTLTGMDEQNVIISMYGSSCGVPQIITKLDRVDDAKILDSLPVGSIICPKKLNCNTIVRYVRAMRTGNGGAITIHSIADGQAEALEFLVDEATPHCETPLKELRLKKNILIVSINRNGKTEIPGGDSFFCKGDTVVVVASRGHVILQLGDIFE